MHIRQKEEVQSHHHGLARAQRCVGILLGSVTQKVLNHLTIPVLVLR